MSAMDALTARSTDLAGRRIPFARATVVRAQHPTSAHAGDSALILADGTIEGFVGGHCAEGSVAAAALDTLETGQPLLLRILPDGDTPYPDAEGARTVVNPCLSGGALEIFVEPSVPAPVVAVVGASPVAQALLQVLPAAGFEGRTSADGVPDVRGVMAVVVASHGTDEDAAIAAAIHADVGYVGLVASRTRGAALLDALDLSPEDRERIHSPAGHDLGARTAGGIAISIVAELVERMERHGLRAPQTMPISRAETATDPMCGMTVTITDDTPHLRHDGVDHWFCGPGCLAGFRDRTATEVPG